MVTCYKLASLLQLYTGIVADMMTAQKGLPRLLLELSDQALEVFFNQLNVRANSLLVRRRCATVGSCLSTPKGSCSPMARDAPAPTPAQTFCRTLHTLTIDHISSYPFVRASLSLVQHTAAKPRTLLNS